MNKDATSSQTSSWSTSGPQASSSAKEAAPPASYGAPAPYEATETFPGSIPKAAGTLQAATAAVPAGGAETWASAFPAPTPRGPKPLAGAFGRTGPHRRALSLPSPAPVLVVAPAIR